MTDIAGKTAFVTGGASGIGLGISKALIKRGANVIIADIRDDHLQAAEAEINNPEKLLTVKLDVTDRKQYAQVIEEAQSRFGNIHILVNNAGVAVVGPVELASYADWDWTMNVNLGGVVNGMVTLLPHMLAHGEGGHIVSTASMSGLVPHPGAVIYTTTKAAVIGMSEAMRGELEPKGIVVSAFCPGPVQSNINEAGKTRPAELADTGYAETDKRRQGINTLAHLFKPAEAIGERVCDGIENNELYILTHSEFKQGVQERANAIVSAVPDIPEDPGLREHFGMLLFNPAHTDEIARHTRHQGETNS